MFSWKIGGRPSHCLTYVDAACFTDTGFRVVSQSFLPINFWFFWGEYKKPVSSMMFGLSPELEMALFTLCFYTREAEDCYVSLADEVFTIKTRHWHHQLRAAFFDFNN